MDEIDLVKAAQPTVAGYPSDDRKAARTRLLAAAAEPAPGARRPARAGRRLSGVPRLTRRAAVAAGLAVAITAAVTISQQLSPDSTPFVVPTANAAEIAHHAATAARNAPFPPLKPNQFVYYKGKVVPGKVRQIKEERGNRVVVDDPAPDPYIAEAWVRYPRKPREGVMMTFSKGDRHYFGTIALLISRHPRLRSLPTDPDQLLAVVYREVQRHPDASGYSVHQRAFHAIAELLGSPMAPPDLQAALYEAMARIPDVTAVQDATDAAGRHGVALARVEQQIRHEVILDKDTYRYLGQASIVVSDHHPELHVPGRPSEPAPWLLRAGEVLSRTALLRIAIVDAVHERPRDAEGAVDAGTAPALEASP